MVVGTSFRPAQEVELYDVMLRYRPQPRRVLAVSGMKFSTVAEVHSLTMRVILQLFVPIDSGALLL